MAWPLEQQLYVQLVRRSNYSSTGSMRVVSATVRPPTVREPGSIIVLLNLAVPREAFDPLTVAKVDVQLEDIDRPTVKVGRA